MVLDLVEEIHLDVCPVILGKGQPRFTDLTDASKLRLVKSATRGSGATETQYEAIRKRVPRAFR